MKNIFNPFSGLLQKIVDSLSDLTTKGHELLDNKEWSAAGHTIDENVPFGGYDLQNVGNITLGKAAGAAKIGIYNVGGNDDTKLLVFSEDANDEFWFESGFSGFGEDGNKLKLKTFWGNNPMTWTGKDVGIGTDTPKGKLHVVGQAIVMADNDTDETQKFSSLVGTHYDTNEELVTLFRAFMGLTVNLIQYGGGGAGSNAATELRFYTAANNTTLLGTYRMDIGPNGRVGIGSDFNSSDAMLEIIPNSTTEEGLTITAPASYTGEFIRLRDNAENVGFKVEANFDVVIGSGAAGKDYNLTFNGENNDGVITWIEDEDYFKFSDDITLADAEFLILDKASGNGIKIDSATPTFGWRDLLGDQFSKNTGGTKPTLVTYNGAVDAWQFSDGDEAFLTFHIPHDYVIGTDIYLHIHWSQNNAGATGGTIDFKYFAIYAKGHNQASGSAFTGTPITALFSSININDGESGLLQYQQHITEVIISGAVASGSLFDRDDFEPDGVIEMTLEMDANNLTGTPSDPFIHYADIHYQSTNIPTKQKAPDFYG